MHWIVASIAAALFLGLYDLSNKHAVRDNAVLPVIFLGTVCMAGVWLVLMAVGQGAPGALPAFLRTAPLDATGHLRVLLKSAIVATSWICTYFAVKQLPVSIAGPIRGSQPLWILAGALVFLGERPSLLQLAGILITLFSFFGLSLAGRAEGVHFSRNRAVWLMLAGTACGAVSSMYDKYLLGHLGLPVASVQAWFSIYLAVLFFPLALGWRQRWWPRNPFTWRWSIPAIAVFLLVSDFLYFTALREPDALIALVASIRRLSVLVAFAGGLLWFNETNGWRKLPAVLGILTGIALTLLG